jgi:dipeptidyl aminopeptidase/acylaminoacyl peptidase
MQLKPFFVRVRTPIALACASIPLLVWNPGTVGAQETAQVQPVVKPGDNLRIEGIPSIPVSLADKVRKYTEARAAAVLDWHPTERSLLISTRFANSNQVHRVSSPGGARYQLTFFNEPVGNAIYEPKEGKYFLFTKDVGGNEFGQIFRQDISTGESTLLTDGGRSQNSGWAWNNKKNLICYGSTRRNGADRDLWIMDPTDPKSDRLAVQVSGGGWSVQDWAPDDATLLIMESLSVNKTNLYLADVATGKRTPLTDPTKDVAYGGAQFSLDGKSVYLTTDELGEFQQLAIMSLADKKTTLLSEEIPFDVESFELSHDGTKMVFSINQRGMSQVFVMDTTTKVKRQVPNLPVGVLSLGPWNAKDTEFAVTISTAQSSSDVFSIDANSLALTRWTESEMGGLVPSELRNAELVEWKSFDGKAISGFLYQPPKRFAGKRPVIINIHGGPEGQSRPVFLGRNNYFLNELGCAILFPNVRGSVGYGKSFVKLDNGLLRLDSVKDIGSLLDWIAESPELDASRVMITGGSYGGYMTLACAVEYNHRIACSLDVVGISHFGTFLKNTESYRRDLRRVEYGDERDPELAAFFEKMAPLNNSGKISKPLFVVQGGNDPRVPLSEAEQMVARVKSNKSPVWYLMASDEGHGFRKKNNADFQFYATVLFVEQYLLGK